MSEEELEKLNNEYFGFTINKADEDIGRLLDENRKLKERIDKAIMHLDLFISDTNLNKYDTLKVLMHTKKILKGEE